jgi:hypothetical protein
MSNLINKEMKTVTIELTEKMDAAVEAFKAIWKDLYSEEEVVIELLKNGIEHYIRTFEGEKEYKKIVKVMKSKGYIHRIWDME